MNIVDSKGASINWYTKNTDREHIYYWFDGSDEIKGFTRIGNAGLVLGDFEGRINRIMNSLGLCEMYKNGFSFRLADDELGAFSNGDSHGLFEEFVTNTGPEFTVFNSFHPYTRELKRMDKVKQFQKDVLTGQKMVEDRHFRTELVGWNIVDVMYNLNSEVRQFVGSFRYYGDMNASFGVDNIIFDSKSRHSFFLHLPIRNKSRSESSLFGNSYQFYIWKSPSK